MTPARVRSSCRVGSARTLSIISGCDCGLKQRCQLHFFQHEIQLISLPLSYLGIVAINAAIVGILGALATLETTKQALDTQSDYLAEGHKLSLVSSAVSLRTTAWHSPPAASCWSSPPPPCPFARGQALVATVNVGGTSYGIAYDSGKGEIFVTHFFNDSSRCSRTRTMRWSLPFTFVKITSRTA